MQTIREWLVQAFGPDAPSRIVTDDPAYLELEVSQPVLASSEHTGALQVCCGGDALVVFAPVKGTLLLLVRDDSAMHRWAAEPREPGRLPTSPCPFATLRLVRTA
jgi:hypothetical protein